MTKYIQIINQGYVTPEEYNSLNPYFQSMYEKHVEMFQIDRLQNGLKQ